MSRIATKNYFRTCIYCDHDAGDHQHPDLGSGRPARTPLDDLLSRRCRVPGCECTHFLPMAYR